MTDKNKMNDMLIDHPKYSDSYRYIGVDSYSPRLNNYSRVQSDRVKTILLTTALLIVSMLLIGKAVGRALDITFSNQDIMLCESAKISGNREYLNKCECYYQSKEIECLQGR